MKEDTKTKNIGGSTKKKGTLIKILEALPRGMESEAS